MTEGPLRPFAGVRLLLEREAELPEGGARYHGSIYTPEARFDCVVAIAADAAVTLSLLGDAAPGERALHLLRAIARTVGRHAIAKSPPAWPRRVLRWRKLD